MAENANQWVISSRYGMLRDLLPIYSLYQLLLNLIVLGLALWLTLPSGHLPTWLVTPLLLGWVFQYVSRPSVMDVSNEHAAWLEELLDEQKYYDRSDSDGRWRATATNWWQRWPHQYIAFSPHGDGTRLVAPRDVMESMRAGLELVEEYGEVSFADDNRAFAFQEPEPEQLAWHMHVPGALLCALCVVAWISHIMIGGMAGWGVSGMALSQGRFETIFLHMFAHGNLMHLVMNMSVLVAIGGTLTARLGPAPLSWLRFVMLFLLSGLAGATLFLMLHPAGSVPMLGASGALYGLMGLLIRAPVSGGALLPVRSTRIQRVGWDLIKQNAFLFALLAVTSWSSGSAGGLAWEAHLGGFLFGLFVGPKFLPRTAPSAALVPGVSNTAGIEGSAPLASPSA